MNKIATTLLVSSLALGGFAVANADDDRYEREDRYERDDDSDKYCDKYGKKFGKRMEYMIEHLELTDEQEKQVRNIRDRYHPKMVELRGKMRENRQQLHEEMHSETIDQAKVKELAQQIGNLKTDKIILHTEMRTEVHKVLTKEQREKIKNRKQRHHDEHGHEYHS